MEGNRRALPKEESQKLATDGIMRVKIPEESTSQEMTLNLDGQG